MRPIKTFVGITALFFLVVNGSARVSEASHIFTTNVTINGIPVAAGNAFTDPLIVVNVGDPITFSFDVFSTFGSPDTLNVTYFQDGGTLSAPPNISFPYDGTGTAGSPVNFTQVVSYATPGTFDGRLRPDLPTSFPDFIFPGGAQGSEVQIPFRLQVNAVPEPASLAVWTMLLLTVAGASIYLKRKVAAPVLN